MQTQVISATRRLMSVLVTIAVAVLGLGVASTATAPGAHAATGTLTGRVTDATTGAPVAGLYVVAYCEDPDYDDWFACDDASTGADGTYGFSLPAGRYRVGVLSATNSYAAAFHGGGTTVYQAKTVTAPVANVDIAVKRLATVGGTVTGAGAGPLNLASVCLTDSYPYVEDGVEKTGWYCSALTFTNTDGTYRLGAPAGKHRIGVTAGSGNWRTTYYASSATPEDATDVTFGESGHQGGFDVTLPRTGKVTGTVTDAATSAPVPYAEVVAWAKRGGSWVDVATATADGAGAYELRVGDGTYRISFDDPCEETCDDDYQTEFWKKAKTVEAADDVVVTGAGTVTGISGALERNGAITGTVKADDGGAPLPDVLVVGYRAASDGGWRPASYAITDGAGRYDLRGGPGVYRVEFQPLCLSEHCTAYAREVYDGVAKIAQGKDVAIVGTGTTPNIDASLAKAPATPPIESLAPPTVVNDPPRVGDLAYAHVGVWNPQPDDVRVTWYRSGSPEPIGTGNVIVVPAEALGQTLSVKVTVAKTGYTAASETSLPSAPVARGELTSLHPPVIFGAPVAGGTVEAWPGAWSAEPTSYSYRWFQSGTATPIGTGKTLVVPASAAGKDLTVEVTAQRADRTDGVATSEPVAVPAATTPVESVTAPAITGTPKVGATLTAGEGTWNPAPDSVEIAWFRSGSEQPIGTGKTLTVPAAAEGELVAARVVAKKAGRSDGVAYTAPMLIAPENAAVESVVPPAVFGTPRVGELLAVHPGVWSPQPDADRTRIEWFRSGSPSPIGTGPTLIVPVEALGQHITARVSAGKAGYAEGQAVSEATGPIEKGELYHYPPAIWGPAVVGATVVAWEGAWPAGPDSFSYAWYVEGSSEPIGTGKQLVIPAGAAGKNLTVTVTATKAGYVDGVATSPPTPVAAAAPTGPSPECALAQAGLAGAKATKAKAERSLAAAKAKVTQLKAKVKKAKKAHQRAKVKRLQAKLRKAKAGKAAAASALSRAATAVSKAQAGVDRSC